MNSHKEDRTNTDPDSKDPYDEFEERMRRIGSSIVAIWKELTIDQRLTHSIAIAGILGLIVYASYTIKIYRTTKNSSDTAAKQLEQTERPWLTIDVTPDSSFEFTNDGGVGFSIRPRIRNIGNSVATDITFDARMVVPPMDNGSRFFHEPIDQQKQLCDKVANAPLGPSDNLTMTLFPTSIDESLSHGLSLSKADIDASKHAVVLKTGPGAIISPFIVGCVDYQFAAAIRHHQTRFIYLVQWHDQTIPPGFVNIVAIKVGQSVNATDVRLQKWSFGGFDAF